MAEEAHVLFHGKLPARPALNRTMKTLGFPFVIKPVTGSLEAHSGYLPILLRREETGVEFTVFDGRATVEELAGKRVDARFERCGSFRWGGDENEMLAGLCTAAALAQLVDGLVLDGAEGKLLSAQAAINVARKALASVSPPPDGRSARLPGTGPADLKRYLKPLLQQRDDLVLVGRRLFIRPLRHLIRGAFLDRTGDRFTLSVHRAVMPLYTPPVAIGFGDDLHAAAWEVWQPHFQALLMAVLAQDVFAPVSGVTTFGDFADYLLEQQTGRQPTAYPVARITALVLAGEHDRAAAYVEQVDGEHHNGTIRKHWERVSRDVGALCADLHAREAETVKALKLEPFWEPSPFPVEMPAAQRDKIAEPAFAMKPWIVDVPSPLQEAPKHPGEVRFAKSFVRRNGGIALLAPLTRQEAEERHRESEDYVLMARLPDGLIIMIRRSTTWDRNAPKGSIYSTRPSVPNFHIELHGSAYVAMADASPDRERPELIEMWSVDVHERSTFRAFWQCHVDFRDDKIAIHDDRTEPRTYTKSALSAAQRDAALHPAPEFGDYVQMSARVRGLLRVAGYGEIE